MFKNLRRHMAFWMYDDVEAIRGSIVFCKLPFNAEHTGVYVGDGIIELNGNGNIQKVTRAEFLNGKDSSIRLSGIAIYVACNEYGYPLSMEDVAKRAENMIGHRRNYNLLTDNCHQFTCGCISGNYENANNFFWMVEEQIKNTMNYGNEIEWRKWRE